MLSLEEWPDAYGRLPECSELIGAEQFAKVDFYNENYWADRPLDLRQKLPEFTGCWKDAYRTYDYYGKMRVRLHTQYALSSLHYQWLREEKITQEQKIYLWNILHYASQVVLRKDYGKHPIRQDKVDELSFLSSQLWILVDSIESNYFKYMDLPSSINIEWLVTRPINKAGKANVRLTENVNSELLDFSQSFRTKANYKDGPLQQAIGNEQYNEVKRLLRRCVMTWSSMVAYESKSPRKRFTAAKNLKNYRVDFEKINKERHRDVVRSLLSLRMRGLYGKKK